MILLLALCAGILSGLRAFMAPAFISFAAWTTHLDTSRSWLAFMGYRWTPWIFIALACVELVTDQLPSTPSRKVPLQFGTRLVMGGLAGGTVGASFNQPTTGLALGVVGAVLGTLGGAWARQSMAHMFGRDRPAALIEDAVALLLGISILWVA